jgi:signal transduction histidine kinase
MGVPLQPAISRWITFWRGLASLLVVAVSLGYGHDFSAAGRQKQVLVLYATRRDAQIVTVGERELPRILDAGLHESLDYYSEYIDRGRFQDPEYRSAVRDFLRLKYRDHHFDVVIAMQDIALAFASGSREALFPGTPVVFFSAAPVAERAENSTGVVAGVNLIGTIKLATTLQPDVRNVFVVSGSDRDDQAYEVLARNQFRPLEQELTFTYLSGLPTTDLERQLASLPAHSIVYYLVVNQDGDRENVNPLAYLDHVAAAANAPVYSWVDSTMDHGVVGGSLKDQTAQTRAVAGLALRVLRGEPADGIPTSSPNLNVDQVDWRQLKKWGISEALVPAGALVRFRNPSTWDRYHYYILSAVGLVLAQSALIAGLLVHRARRRRAEEQVRSGQVELQESYARIHDLGGRLLNAQEGERARIARELHDDIGQQIALLAIDLELLSASNPTTLAVDALSRAQGVARSVHDLSHRLHPAKLRLIGLVAALTGLQHEPSHSGIPTTFTHDNVPRSLPPDVTLCLFRIVQEALQNAMKYSGAHMVSVHLSGTPDGLVLTVDDDGRGFEVDTAWGTGLGLMSMSERVEAVGGTLQVRSQPGAGTHLEVKVPLRSASDAERRADSA